jgi:S1-C subfamily serine protease
VVDAVARGSQADRIGLRPGDLLIKLNDRVVRNLKEFRREYARLRFRSNVTIQILRGRYLYYVTLELGGFPS